MIINWFPGHMSRSLREIGESIKRVDAVVYVLDARAPLSCINPEFDKLISNRPIVYALNKADMVPENELPKWIEKLSTNGNVAVKLNSTATSATRIIVEKLKILCAPKVDRQKARGINAIVRAMVIGVPNSGKSTLINNLCGKTKALTGNKAGVTKAQQWVKIGQYLEVMDTPGTLYPKLENKTVAHNLAFLGSIRDEILDTYELSLELLKKLYSISDAVQARYDIVPSGNVNDDLGNIARKRGLLVRGGEPDYERAASAVIDDFRKGRMGKIILERADLL